MLQYAATMAMSVQTLVREDEMGPGIHAEAWAGLAWVTEAKVDTPKHKARTQMMHERARKPVPEDVQPGLAIAPGWCFVESRDERENIVVWLFESVLYTGLCSILL
jgi:hypothetical protein